jgi:hypothetical protein
MQGRTRKLEDKLVREGSKFIYGSVAKLHDLDVEHAVAVFPCVCFYEPCVILFEHVAGGGSLNIS